MENRSGFCYASSCSAAIIALGIFISCGGCAGPRTTNRQEQPLAQSPGALASGDVVKVSFPGSPELNQEQKIRADGKISLPLIGEVEAAGKSLRKFQNELVVLYKPQLKNTEVVVTLESSAIPVFVSGAVKSSGKLVFERPTTLLEAIMAAGGAAPEANLKKIRVIRLVNGEHRTQVVDLKPALSGVTARAFYVRGGDVIFVPENVINF